jgi:hypothetical protein
MVWRFYRHEGLIQEEEVNRFLAMEREFGIVRTPVRQCLAPIPPVYNRIYRYIDRADLRRRRMGLEYRVTLTIQQQIELYGMPRPVRGPNDRPIEAEPGPGNDANEQMQNVADRPAENEVIVIDDDEPAQQADAEAVVHGVEEMNIPIAENVAVAEEVEDNEQPPPEVIPDLVVVNEELIPNNQREVPENNANWAADLVNLQERRRVLRRVGREIRIMPAGAENDRDVVGGLVDEFQPAGGNGEWRPVEEREAAGEGPAPRAEDQGQERIGGLCVVCTVNQVNTMYYPCGHTLACSACAHHQYQRSTLCIWCREEATQLIWIRGRGLEE